MLNYSQIFVAKLTFFSKYPLLFCNFVKKLHKMTPEEKIKIEEKIIEYLRTVVDPEMAVDIYSLGMIYNIDLDDSGNLTIDMTLTAPGCPMADFLMEDVRQKMSSVEGVKSVQVNLVFEPVWNPDMMSEEAKLLLGFL